ncbi:hypothetical protein CABS01_07875 [Colletotrichum abscissum]|uniref:uncharacterized protein n=1 Tax=Colletotrichum abscissum TaxID=1671311 RepID=UPI0027D4F88A|nr:uncharacterized protein CABS01_07875 [Colletotrichum abscissum]KAK1510203.1 hypothetical protein CABS01_07875 [Colletotrichum abscissum]
MASKFVVQWVTSDVYSFALPVADDPFRHHAGANSHNHHTMHPWGDEISVGTKEFDALYAEGNNKYLYHLWYSDQLTPFMATEVLKIETLSAELLAKLGYVLQKMLNSNMRIALGTPEGKFVVASIQSILDDATKVCKDPIFIRLSATSAKDSFANGAPTAKPDPLPPTAEVVLGRLLTSGRVAGRLLALADGVWSEDPGEALVVERWSPEIRLEHELRVFCYKGKVTAVSQDIWWEKKGWRERYSDGLVEAVVDVWNNVKGHIPFDTCTMDVLVTPPSQDSIRWDAKVIEFNGFGPHLNTGSDLFHWTTDASILQGESDEITVRFVDDWENSESDTDTLAVGDLTLSDTTTVEDNEPDWMMLEKEIQEKYADDGKNEARLELLEKNKLPLGGRWCSAY